MRYYLCTPLKNISVIHEKSILKIFQHDREREVLAITPNHPYGYITMETSKAKVSNLCATGLYVLALPMVFKTWHAKLLSNKLRSTNQ